MATKSSNDFKVKMVMVEGNELPFVEVGFICKDGSMLKGMMVLDSCCVYSMVFGDVVAALPEGSVVEGRNVKVNSMEGSVSLKPCVKVEFSIGSTVFQSEMLADDRDCIGYVSDVPILGILGNAFFQQYDLAMDFSNFTLHKSVVDHSNFCISQSSFFFVMEIGLNRYGVPILVLGGKNGGLVAIADTGATANVITKKALEKAELKYVPNDEIINLENINTTEEAKTAKIDFAVNGLEDSGDKCKEYPHQDVFAISNCENVLPHDVWTRGGSDNPDIEAILGCPFIAGQGWTLDFGAMIIYKRKEEEAVA